MKQPYVSIPQSTSLHQMLLLYDVKNNSDDGGGNVIYIYTRCPSDDRCRGDGDGDGWWRASASVPRLSSRSSFPSLLRVKAELSALSRALGSETWTFRGSTCHAVVWLADWSLEGMWWSSSSTTMPLAVNPLTRLVTAPIMTSRHTRTRVQCRHQRPLSDGAARDFPHQNLFFNTRHQCKIRKLTRKIPQQDGSDPSWLRFIWCPFHKDTVAQGQHCNICNHGDAVVPTFSETDIPISYLVIPFQPVLFASLVY